MRHALVLGFPVLLSCAAALAACGGESGGEEAYSALGEEPSPAGSSRSDVRAASPPADACGWLAAGEVAGILGELSGTPTVVRSVDDVRPHPQGVACAYRLQERPGRAPAEVVVQVTLNDGVAMEGALGAMRDGIAGALPPGTANTGRGVADTSANGWDFEGVLPPRTYTARVGHVGVRVATADPDIPKERLAALAASVRDGMPDLPFRMPVDPVLAELDAALGDEGPAAPPAGPDPCGLLTAEEAESVLGRLAVPPYRANGDSPLWDPHGESCAYFTSRHRALVLRPTWSAGAAAFAMAVGVDDAVASVAQGDASVDTLDGPWEGVLAPGGTGSVRFLRGERMLELVYGTSSTDLTGAIRLARLALTRL